MLARILTAAVVLALAGCSGGDDAAAQKKSNDYFAKSQKQALDAAKNVGKVLQSGAEKEKKALGNN